MSNLILSNLSLLNLKSNDPWHSHLGLAVTPVDKLLKADTGLKQVIGGSMQVKAYRALLGLLKHLTYIYGGRRLLKFGC